MSKLTPIQALEERIRKLENAESYSDWFVGEWYKTFEQPLRADVDMLKEKQDKRDVKDYWDNFRSEGLKLNKSIKPSFIGAYWLSCAAGFVIGSALMLVVRLSGILQ